MTTPRVQAAAEGLSPPARCRFNPKAPRAEDNLSFFRRATNAEREAGANPLLFWSVEPTGSYTADVQRGKAIAQELVDFLVATPTNGNMTMMGCILVDMQRFADIGHRGLLVGFGSVIAKFAVIGASLAGSDALSKMGEAQ